LTPAVLSAGLAALLVITAAAGGVQALTYSGHPDAPQGVTDQANRSVEWNLFPDVSPAALWIVSTSVNAPSPDEFKITYNHGSFSLAYERTAGGAVTSQFTVSVTGLVEWAPSGDGQFSEGTIIAYTPLGASAFGRVPIVHSESTTPTGGVVHSFLIQSNSGELTMNLTISQGFVTLPSGSTLTPMEAELTFELNHLMNRTDTRLSLQLSLTTNTPGQNFTLQNQSWDDEHEFSQNESAVNVTNPSQTPPSSAWFAWSNRAEVNGMAGRVDVTGPEVNETTGGYDLYLSYPRILSGTNPDQISIMHDPSLGVVSSAYQSIINKPTTTTGIQPDIPLYVGTAAAMAALVGGTILLTRRQRRERR
jgi:hypothetical protein